MMGKEGERMEAGTGYMRRREETSIIDCENWG